MGKNKVKIYNKMSSVYVILKSFNIPSIHINNVSKKAFRKPINVEKSVRQYR